MHTEEIQITRKKGTMSVCTVCFDFPVIKFFFFNICNFCAFFDQKTYSNHLPQMFHEILVRKFATRILEESVKMSSKKV